MKRLLNAGLKLLVSAGLILYLVRGMDWQKLDALLAGAELWFYAAAVLFFALSNFLGALQWHLLLRAQALAIPFGKSLLIYFMREATRSQRRCRLMTINVFKAAFFSGWDSPSTIVATMALQTRWQKCSN